MPDTETRAMPAPRAPLSYDIVMATRNRPEAVALSVPLILAQSRLPREVFIVDSSDDDGPIRKIAQDAADSSPVPVHYIRSDSGSSYQRNLGLRQVTGDVVIFPDDDSLLYPDAAAAMMAVYEADPDGRIAAVCARPAETPPPGVLDGLDSYAAETMTPLRRALRGGRQQVKERLGALNPFVSIGTRLNAQHGDMSWLAGIGAETVPYMTGFRMSFRRGAIDGFDEALRRYAWFEDIDASFRAMSRGLVVMAPAARIYHHRAAAHRDNGYRMGLWAILNRAYVVMKAVHGNPTVFASPRREIARLRAYCTLRGLAYRAMARDSFGKDRARGAAAGIGRLQTLTRAAPGQLTEAYSTAVRDEA